MIIALIIIAIAFYILLRETEYLTIQLPTGKPIETEPEKPVNDYYSEYLKNNMSPKQVENNSDTFIPTEFTPCDIPDLSGEYNMTQFEICESWKENKNGHTI